MATIHLIDDDKPFREALSRLLELLKFNVKNYASAAEFLLKNLSDEPSCIVLDVGLPVLDGPTLHRGLNALGRQTPIIYLSGDINVETAVTAIKDGAIDFLTKPVKKKALLGAIEKALEEDVRRKRQARETAETRARFQSLTPREREVYFGVIAGKLNKQIAYCVGASERTIKAHRAPGNEQNESPVGGGTRSRGGPIRSVSN